MSQNKKVNDFVYMVTEQNITLSEELSKLQTENLKKMEIIINESPNVKDHAVMLKALKIQSDLINKFIKANGELLL